MCLAKIVDVQPRYARVENHGNPSSAGFANGMLVRGKLAWSGMGRRVDEYRVWGTSWAR